MCGERHVTGSGCCHTAINPPLYVWCVPILQAKLPKSPGYRAASTSSSAMAGTSAVRTATRSSARARTRFQSSHGVFASLNSRKSLPVNLFIVVMFVREPRKRRVCL